MRFAVYDISFLSVLLLLWVRCEAAELSIKPKGCEENTAVKPKVAFLAWFTNSGVSLGDGEAVKFDKVVNNIGGGYDPRTGHFEAPVTGIYSISASVMSQPSNSMHLGVMKNNEMVTMLFSNSGTYPQASQTINLRLNKGDTMWIQRRSGRVLHAHKTGPYNIFSGVLIDVL